jgi:hypothetical protein
MMRNDWQCTKNMPAVLRRAFGRREVCSLNGGETAHAVGVASKVQLLDNEHSLLIALAISA